MTATNPFKVRDLLHKYGWDALVYLSNLGVNLLSEAQVLFVDSGATNALDADDTVHGHSFEMPLATLDFAIGLCTADQGDVILAAPGHSETISGASGCTIDVDDVTIIGVGVRDKRPKFTFSAAASTIEIDADNITIKNFQFVPSYAGEVAVGLDIQAGSVAVTLDGCYFYETANTSRFNVCISLEDEVDFFTVKNCEFMNLFQGGNDSALLIEDDADYLVVDNCIFHGDYTEACLDLDVGAINYPVIKNSLFYNQDTTAGACVKINSATIAVIANCDFATGNGALYPINDITASYSLNNNACEAGAETTILVGGATQTDLSS